MLEKALARSSEKHVFVFVWLCLGLCVSDDEWRALDHAGGSLSMCYGQQTT